MRNLLSRWVCMAQGGTVPNKHLQGDQSLQEKFWESSSLQKWVSWSGQLIKAKSQVCRATKGRKGQDRSSLKKREPGNAVGGLQPLLLPRKGCPLWHTCTQHVYCVTCMLVEWRQILSNEVCVRNGGCILLLSLLPLLLKSSDNHSVSGCVGSCLTSLTYHVFAGEWY